MNTASRTNPLYSENRMKLGAMAFNCSHGSTITSAEGAWEMNWPDTKDVVRMADGAGLEALLPVGRWKGYGGPTNFNNRTFESFTWAAGVGALCTAAGANLVLQRPDAHSLAQALALWLFSYALLVALLLLVVLIAVVMPTLAL